MSTDYLTMADDEVKTLFGQIAEVVKALQTASVNYRPSICSERYLTGDEVCEYLHISVRTLQTLCGIDGSFLSPLSGSERFSIPNRVSARFYTRTTDLPKIRSNQKQAAHLSGLFIV